MPRNFARRARGTLTILRVLPGQARVHSLPREQLEELRDRRVRAIVRYAAEHVPYYRDFFRNEQIDPREIASADDLVVLPSVEREIVQADPEQFRPTASEGREAVRFRTSGTTGRPLVVWHDRRSLLENVAYSQRERRVEAALVGKRVSYSVADIRYRGSPLDTIQGFYAGASFRPLRPRLLRVQVELPVDDVVAQLNELRPDVIRGNGAYLDALFRHVAATGKQLHPPRVVFYVGQAMSAGARALIEQHFGSMVLSRYNAVEAHKIAFLCEQRDGFHLHEDLCHLVLLDGDGKPATPGEPGEVAISNLVNRGMVLLNYRLGDVARVALGPCRCGRTTARLVDVEGRSDEILLLPDGDLVSPRAIFGAITGIEGLVRYQLVQHEPDRYELRLSTVVRGAYDRAVPGVLAEVRALLRGCRVDASYHERLEPAPGQKFRPVATLPRQS